MQLSIIIPAYNEQHKIARDVTAAGDFLQAHGLAGEVIVVDDGSRDGTAAAAQQAATSCPVPCRVLRYAGNRGKGFAVRAGMLASAGDVVMFADSGLNVPFDHALAGLQMLRDRTCELAHGSRKLPQSAIVLAQPWYRRWLSRLFGRLIRAWLQLPSHLTDTQCGFKLYCGAVARRLYRDCATAGFMFDLEIILRAQALGYRLREFPVAWRCDPDSRLSLLRSPWPILVELLRIRYWQRRQGLSPAE